MPEFYSQAAIDASRGMDAFTRGYIVALYFTESGDYDDELTPEENSDNGAQRHAFHVHRSKGGMT